MAGSTPATSISAEADVIDSSSVVQDVEEGDELMLSRQHSRGSGASIELRKEARRKSRLMSATAIQLLGDLDDFLQDSSDHVCQAKSPNDEEKLKQPQQKKIGFLKSLFLNPSYSLRKQMFVTFGTISTITIVIIIIVSIAAAYIAGYQAKQQSMTNAEELFKKTLGTTARYVAESISPRLMPVDVADIMKEFLLDRFAGYPDVDDDSATPFFSSTANASIYPIAMTVQLPLDWDFSHTPDSTKGNVNETNYDEHVQNSNRLSWYSKSPRLSTMNSFYFMQGSCNPDATVTDTVPLDYYPNCTDANNDINTGGIIAPTSVNSQIARKGAALSPLLKALFEYHKHVKEIGYYFSNSGAGALMQFPHYEINGRSSYVSIGCDWMRELNPTNPELGPIATEDEISRCHANGTVVPSREYNTLERGWCRDQALNPDKFLTVGPYQDAWDPSVWLVTAGKAVYDSNTGKFIACILIDITLDSVNDVLDEVGLDTWAAPIVSRWDDGIVLTAAKFDFNKEPTTIFDPSLETGVDHDTFDAIKSLVDFNSEWDPDEAKTKFQETSFGNDESSILYASPIPPIPTKYDSGYFPQFVSILSISKDEALQHVVDDLGNTVDHQVRNIVVFTSITGIVGIIVIFLVIFASASFITKPLRWMDSVGSEIVYNFGGKNDSDIDIEFKRGTCICSPNTELDALVKQFTRIIKRFSRLGTAKRVDVARDEVANEFTYSKEFAELYKSRDEENFPFKYDRFGVTNKADDDDFKVNLGQNIRDSDANANTSASVPYSIPIETSAEKSPLFYSIAAFIILPVLIFSLIISAVVVWKISTFADLIEPVKNNFITLHDNYLFSSTALRASFVSSTTEVVARDLHIMTRYATWLFFGALEIAADIDMLGSGAEKCKSTPLNETCEWVKDQPCDCSWSWHFDGGDTCTAYDERDSRHLQKLYMASQRDNAWPDGTRNFTASSFATSPAETEWYEDLSELPGSSKSDHASLAASNFGTSFHRARTASAMAGVIISLYNVMLRSMPAGLLELPLLALTFEADGMEIGYSGCTPASAVNPFWASSKENGAAELQPDICPLGKHGFDARCRSWYDDGKKKATSGSSVLHITAPYAYASLEGTVAQSGTSAMMNRRTNEYIGQIIVDFVSLTLVSVLESDTELSAGGFSFLITPDSSTIVGPGYSREEANVPIKDIVMKEDNCTSENQSTSCDEFFAIVEEMTSGGSGSKVFTRTTSAVGEENIRISFAPVYVDSFNPMDSSNLASGVTQEKNLIYSVALAAPEQPMLEPFQEVKASTQSVVVICIVTISLLVVVITILLGFLAYRVGSSLTISILHLLKVLRDMNENDLEEDHLQQMSQYIGSSCIEVDSVYATVETLFQIMRFANQEFYSGNLVSAYKILRDSLRLFSRLKNKKAIAVASNNLGILCLTIYRAMLANGDEHFEGKSLTDIVSEGSDYCTVAIKLGEEQYEIFYEDQGWSQECLQFMQGLANRYFNRALLLLSAKTHATKPADFEADGFRDIQITADMDLEIVDQCTEMGFKIDRVERYDLMLSRSRGAHALVKLTYPPEDLFVEDIVDELLTSLRRALQNPGDELFRDMNPAGRMQILDSELIKYSRRVKKDNELAAKVAIRCLVEDEYVISDTMTKALKTLLVYVKSGGSSSMTNSDRDKILEDLTRYIEELEKEFVQRASMRSSANSSAMKSVRLVKFFDDGDEIDESVHNKSERMRRLQRRSSVLKEATRGDFVVETF